MDILRVLSSPDLEVRKKTLQLVLDLVTSRNIHEVLKIWRQWLFSYYQTSSAEFHWVKVIDGIGGSEAELLGLGLGLN